MSTVITQINATADTFQVWLSRTNEVINAISTITVTANGDANGSVTTGNAFVNGVFSTVVMSTGTLRGGNVQSGATMNIVSNVAVINGSSISIGNTTVNTSINSTSMTVASISVQNLTSTVGTFPGGISISNVSLTSISNTIPVSTVSVIDTFLISSNTISAEYTLTVKDNNSNAYQVSKLLLCHDGGSVSITEYAVITTNGSIGVFSASINATAVALSFDATTSNNATIKGWRSAVVI